MLNTLLARAQALVTRLKDPLLVVASIGVFVLAVAYYSKSEQLGSAVHQFGVYQRQLAAAELHIAADERTIAASEQDQAAFSVSAVQSNVDARFDDCHQLNAIRAGLRASVRQSRATAPLLFKLVPSLDTGQVKRLVRVSDRRQLHEFRRINCRAYAKRAIPAGDKRHYQVP